MNHPNKTPKVTVIIPCYNAEEFVEEAVLSIINQSYKALEIITIDDGSKDKTATILTSLQAKDDRINFISNETNIGLIDTLNKGIKAANGEYIARMDADDISHSERIKKQIDFLIENPELSIVGTAAVPINMQGKQVNQLTNAIYCTPNTLSFSSLFTQPLVHGSVVGKAEIFKSNLYSKEFKHNEDFELWNRLISKNVSIANIPEELYYYRLNSEGVSNQNTAIQINNHNKTSHLYISKRFQLDISMNIIEIMNNRPTKHIHSTDYRKAIQLFNDLYHQFEHSSELSRYYYSQRINIVTQAFKQKISFTLGIILVLDFLTYSIISGSVIRLLKRKLYSITYFKN